MPVSKPEGRASKHFTWAELLLLPSWGVYHDPTDEQRANLIKLASKMDEIRDFLGRPINVSCAIRPSYVQAVGSQGHGRNYNQAVHGAPKSAHLNGLAMDFTVSGITCDEVRFLLLEELERFGVRMERKDGAGWVHIDIYPVKTSRYFVP